MNKKIAYTVCSANHLAYAKTMADSLLAQHPEYTIFIGLVDRIDNRFDVSFFQPHIIIEAEALQIAQFAKMSAQYNIIELNCAVKPFMAQYLFKNYSPDTLLYFDTDIFIYHSLEKIEEALLENDIVLTPHFTNPMNDDLEPRERDMLRSGLYNAGFISMKNTIITNKFLQWWSERLINQCYYNFAEGMGVDQYWLNLVPLFFDKVGIFNHKGANVAYWNLHERILSKMNNAFFVNASEPLLFLHISGYKFDKPDELSRHQTRFNLSQLAVLNELITEYRNAVYNNGYEKFSAMSCYFSKPIKKSTGLMATINKLLKPLKIKLTGL